MKQDTAVAWTDLLAMVGDMHTLAGVESEHMHTLYLYACQCADRGDLKTADQILYTLLLLDAWNFDYTFSLGVCRQRQGRHKEALLYFLQAHSVRCADPRPFYYAALSHQKLGDANSARHALASVMQCNLDINDNFESQSYLAQCLALRKKAEQLLAQLPIREIKE